MKLDYKNTRYTLDFDNTTYKELLAKIFAVSIDKDTLRLKYRRSCRRNGYHVVVETKVPVLVLPKRKKFGDDRKRMMHDILNRPDHIHDVLWSRKTINGRVYRAGKWSAWLE